MKDDSKELKKAILKLLKKEGSMETKDIAEHFGIKKQLVKDICSELSRKEKIFFDMDESYAMYCEKKIDFMNNSDLMQASGGVKIEGKLGKIEPILDDEELAEFFHNEYEKAAEAYGWNTQKKCKTDFWSLPEANRKTMIATIIQFKNKFKIEIKEGTLKPEEKDKEDRIYGKKRN